MCHSLPIALQSFLVWQISSLCFIFYGHWLKLPSSLKRFILVVVSLAFQFDFTACMVIYIVKTFMQNCLGWRMFNRFEKNIVLQKCHASGKSTFLHLILDAKSFFHNNYHSWKYACMLENFPSTQLAAHT